MAALFKPSLDLFLNKKVFPSRIVNYAGLQPIRVVLFAAAHRILPRIRNPDLSVHKEEFNRNGILLIPNFLTENKFKDLQDKWKEAVLSDSKRAINEDYTRGNIEVLNRRLQLGKPIFSNSVLPLLMTEFTGRPVKEATDNLYYQLIRHAVDGSKLQRKDEEQLLHRDHCFPVFKAWLYLNDSTIENGALWYAPGSHKISWGRLAYEYRDSIGKEVNSPDWRISPKTVRGLPNKPRQYICKKNTLVIANNFGFHNRGEIKKGFERHAVHLSFQRENPARSLVLLLKKS